VQILHESCPEWSGWAVRSTFTARRDAATIRLSAGDIERVLGVTIDGDEWPRSFGDFDLT